ncbi:hypothetical protein M8C21_018457 [Ambrosia artemisiifolia]|uniref:Uncharacterized protein n=1 Tax=Ambrosia artemisiifolia TaxID=4212 RepID=A0AAD5G7N8_AMBAR|nr:hypothetical protein M8C21_018457 [Ambrosia artemisiifolia]
MCFELNNIGSDSYSYSFISTPVPIPIPCLYRYFLTKVVIKNEMEVSRVWDVGSAIQKEKWRCSTSYRSFNVLHIYQRYKRKVKSGFYRDPLFCLMIEFFMKAEKNMKMVCLQ